MPVEIDEDATYLLALIELTENLINHFIQE